MRVRLPGRDRSFEVPTGRLLGVFEGPRVCEPRAGGDIVAEALAAPIGAPRLRDMVSGCRRVAIIVDDVTRPTPTDLLLPPVLEELRRGGVTTEHCSILIAGGTHRPMTPEEVERKLGAGLARALRVEFHSATTADLVALDDPAGLVPIRVNALAAEADFVIGVGQILPHAISGFSGGGKILAPGIAGRETIEAVHWSMHRSCPEALYWFRDNPVREVIDRVALRSGMRFIVDMVADGCGEIAGVVAGHPVAAHREGCGLAERFRGVAIPGPADMVIADAWPFDVDWWQAIKALPAAARVCRPGGTIIVIADCPEGFAPEYREPVTYGYPVAEEVVRMVDRGVLDGIVGAHMLIGSAALRDGHRIVLVTRGLTEEEVRGMGFRRSATVEEALAGSLSEMGSAATVAVLPGAAQGIPRLLDRSGKDAGHTDE